MQPLFILPGRVRWHVPAIFRQPALAAAIAEVLSRHPEVESVKASASTGNLLLLFDRQTPLEEAARWVRDALVRAMRPGADDEALGPGAALEPRDTQLQMLRRLGEHTRPHKALVRRAMTASFLNRLLDSSPPLLIGAGIDIVTRGPGSLLRVLGFATARSQLLALGGLGLAVWFTDAWLDFVHRKSAAELADTVRNDLRNELYQHIQRLDMAQLETRDVSDWLGLINGDLSRIHGFIKDGSDPIVTIVANSVAVGGTLLTLSPAFALAQLLMVPPVVFASKQLLGPMVQRLIAAIEDQERLAEALHGNVSSLATIRSFNAMDAEAARVAEAGRAQMRTTAAANELSARYVPALTAIVGTSFTGTVVAGGFQVLDGKLTTGAYNVVATAQLRLLAAIGAFGGSLDNYQRTSVALRRVFEVLDIEPTITSRPDAVPFTGVTRDIVFDDVGFGYEPDRLVLRGMTLRFPAGKTVGVVGSSGAGKSTVLKLLLRFYDVQAGTLRYDDVDVRDLRVDDLRAHTAMVAQELAVFSGSIRDNIAYARPGATDDQIEHAAHVAEAHEFIHQLPEGYDTRVGFGGFSLSAGQRQRLAIARVVLADRPILLFDEATSALDYETEAAVQRSLAEVTAGRTTVIVAHRLSTIRRADLIYVLDDGQVKEAGTHDELLEADGIYASMWKVQTGELIRKPRRDA
ncbi:MAG: ATP-binding cassette domain-containing protein [Vicinamibacterales bacterium]|nr:ATP-binding cassette domain-containing protein [Vicinamibacterales bacterium]